MAESDSDADGIPMSEDDADHSDYEPEHLTLKAKRIKRGNSGRWKLFYDNRCFRKEWLDLYPWVEEDPDDPKYAICRACNKKIKAHKGILDTHQKTKTHLKNLSGSDDIEEDEDDPKKADRSTDPKTYNTPPTQPSMEQLFDKLITRLNSECEWLCFSKITDNEKPSIMLGDDQFSFFSESPIDAAHQAITNLIDKLVEKFHENRVENLRIQNETLKHLKQAKSHFAQTENQRKVERRLAQETQSREAEAVHLKFMQQEHELKINCMERERDAKLKAVEQQLMFARQEYERKVKLLDQQLQSMK